MILTKTKRAILGEAKAARLEQLQKIVDEMWKDPEVYPRGWFEKDSILAYLAFYCLPGITTGDLEIAFGRTKSAISVRMCKIAETDDVEIWRCVVNLRLYPEHYTGWYQWAERQGAKYRLKL